MGNSSRSFALASAVVLGSALLGGLLGPETTAVAASGSADDVKANLESFSRVYGAVEANFSDALSPDKAIYKGAIPGMLRTLDPHSTFFDPKDFQSLREDQRGHYYGVGMKVGPRDGKTIVIAPFGGGPAYRAGLRPGDVILEVNDKRTDNLSTSEIADLLKGPKGTKVAISVGRDGVDKPLSFTVIRDEIKRNSVEEAFWLKPGIAYMAITSFNETTSQEMDQQFEKLGEDTIKGLIIDLRGNPGGLLNEGVGVAGHFLRRNELVVSHRGRNSPEKPYFAKGSPYGESYPIVVMVNS